jgi:hypothetical protein
MEGFYKARHKHESPTSDVLKEGCLMPKLTKRVEVYVPNLVFGFEKSLNLLAV